MLRALVVERVVLLRASRDAESSQSQPCAQKGVTLDTPARQCAHRVWGREEGLDREEDGPDLEGGRPFICGRGENETRSQQAKSIDEGIEIESFPGRLTFQDVEAYAPELVCDRQSDVTLSATHLDLQWSMQMTTLDVPMFGW